MPKPHPQTKPEAPTLSRTPTTTVRLADGSTSFVVSNPFVVHASACPTVWIAGSTLMTI